LATATASAAYVSATHKHGPQLAELLPSDLDALESPTVIGALGVQLLLFSGCFVLRDGRWVRECSSRPSLLERVERVAPTWKPGGQVDYTWSANAAAAASGTQLSPTLNLFEAAASLPRAVRVASEAATVSSMASSLEAELGMSAADFDAPARAAIREMLTWHLPAPAERRLPAHGDLTLLVLSFDATPHCQSVTDCQQPGPSNELLAATAAAFVRERREEHDQQVHVVAQWEVAAAIRMLESRFGSVQSSVQAVGTPGRFENTAQIFTMMRALLPSATTCVDLGVVESDGSPRVVLLAHPDHLRRGLRIGQAAFAKAARAEEAPPACPPLAMVPAMLPYRLDWPRRRERPLLDLYANVSAHVHTGGHVRLASWHDANHGYFPDGDPQRWAHRREVFLCYEFWARAKGVATGVIALEDEM